MASMSSKASLQHWSKFILSGDDQREGSPQKSAMSLGSCRLPYLFSTATGVPGSRTQREVAGGDHAPRRLQHGGRSVLGDKRSRDGRPWRWPAESGCLWNWGIRYGRWWSTKSWDTLFSNKFRWTLEYKMIWETKDNTLGSPKLATSSGILCQRSTNSVPESAYVTINTPAVHVGQLGSSRMGFKN